MAVVRTRPTLCILEDRSTPATSVLGGVVGPVPVGAGLIGPGLPGFNTLPAPLLAGGTPDGNGVLFQPNQTRTGYLFPGTFQQLIPGFNGTARVALGDITGDAVPDLIAGAGPGGQRVVVRDGVTGALLLNILPFETSFNGGVFVSVGDINRDGFADIVVTPDQSGGPRVIIYDGLSASRGLAVPFADYLGIADRAGVVDTNFRGGARTAVGDINGNGFPDVIVAAGFGGGPRVTVWDGIGLADPNTLASTIPPIANFFAFEQTLRNGVWVGAGDVNGDGCADMIFGGGPGGGPRIRIANGDLVSVITTDFSLDDLGREGLTIASFFAGDPNTRGGVHVTARNLDGDAFADVVTGSGENLPAEVRVYRGTSILANPGVPNLDQVFTPFTRVTAEGVYVG